VRQLEIKVSDIVDAQCNHEVCIIRILLNIYEIFDFAKPYVRLSWRELFSLHSKMQGTTHYTCQSKVV